MDLYFWFITGFILTGFIVIASMKKSMESKLALIKESRRNEEILTQQIIWWIVGTTAWGIVSIILIVWWFSVEF